MSFAAPIALAFLGLFIPVILLYLLKQRRRQVEVPTLLFWDKILKDEQTVTSLNKLKKWLSLFLQLLFILLLTLALARPLLSDKLTGARRIVVLLDNSASMSVKEGEKLRFDLAKEKALDVIRGLSIGDTLMLVAVAAEPDIVQPFTDSKRTLMNRIEELDLTHGITDYQAALSLIGNLPTDDRETLVYLITDGAFEPVKFDPPEKTQFAFLQIGKAKDNVGITAFQVRPLPASPRDFQIHIEMVNETADEQRIPVELNINSNLIDAYEFTIPAGEKITRTLKQFSDAGGSINVFADFDDAFPLDNRAYAVLPRPEPIKVQLITEGNLFLESALLTDDQVDLEVVHPEVYPSTNTAEVKIYSGWAPTATPGGNCIFVSAWPKDLGLRSTTNVIEKPFFTDWDREHPINRHVALKNVSIEKAAALQAPKGFKTLASSFDNPLMLLRDDPDRKIMIVGFDTLSSDLPLRVAFPIILGNAVRHLAGVEIGEQWLNPDVGEILTRGEVRYYARFRQGSTNEIASVLNPEDKLLETTDEESLVPVDRAGIYRGDKGDGQAMPLFAANLTDRTESRIAPAEKLPIVSEQPLPEITDGFRLGFEPTYFLVLIALLLSLSEWFLFHRRFIE